MTPAAYNAASTPRRIAVLLAELGWAALRRRIGR